MTPLGATIVRQYKPATGRKSVAEIYVGSNPINPTTWFMTKRSLTYLRFLQCVNCNPQNFMVRPEDAWKR